MRVLYLIDSLVPGGAERSLASMAGPLVDRGVELEVAYLHDRPGLQEELRSAGARLFCLAGDGGRAGWLRRARRLIEERRPDLVHTTLFEADLVGRTAAFLTRTPVVSSLVNEAYGPEHLADPGLRLWKLRAAQLADLATARFVWRFHAVSRAVADAMARRLLVPRHRIEVIPRGRDPNRLGVRTPARRAAARARLGIPDGTPLILAVARQEHQKGLDVLLRAMALVRARVPETRLVVAGREGNQTPSLRALRERLGLADAVLFLGARDDVPELLCAADVFVLPSRREGFPGALVEAMALEAPIVASDLPEVREAVGSTRAALLVPPEDPVALAEAVVETLGDPRRAAARTRWARRRFLERFTVDRVADRMVRFYRAATRNGRGQA